MKKRSKRAIALLLTLALCLSLVPTAYASEGVFDDQELEIDDDKGETDESSDIEKEVLGPQLQKIITSSGENSFVRITSENQLTDGYYILAVVYLDQYIAIEGRLNGANWLGADNLGSSDIVNTGRSSSRWTA